MNMQGGETLSIHAPKINVSYIYPLKIRESSNCGAFLMVKLSYEKEEK